MDSFDAGVVSGMEKVAVTPRLAGRYMALRHARAWDRHIRPVSELARKRIKGLAKKDPGAFHKGQHKATGLVRDLPARWYNPYAPLGS